MRLLKGHRFRLDLTEAQDEFCARTAGVCRFVWNLALEQRSQAWTHGRHSVRYNAQSGDLAGLKALCPWVSEAPHHCLQQTLRDLDRAFQNFFEGRAAYPKFRRKGLHDAFRFPDPAQFVVDEARQRMKLPKLGWVAYRNGRGRHALKLAGRAKSVTVSREGGHWFASVLCEVEVADPLPIHGIAVGVDLGVAQAITLSTGEVLPVRGMTAREERKLARLQRELARRKKGSRNRARTQQKLARFHARVARRRRDDIHKATTYLAKNHRLVVVEGLRVKDMTRAPKAKAAPDRPGRFLRNGASAKAGLNRAILARGWGEVRRQLEYKAAWYGSKVAAVDPAYTSQRCEVCGHTEAGNRPAQSKFKCRACGHEAHADVNAARNILAAGLAATACGAMPQLGGRRSRKPAA